MDPMKPADPRPNDILLNDVITEVDENGKPVAGRYRWQPVSHESLEIYHRDRYAGLLALKEAIQECADRLDIHTVLDKKKELFPDILTKVYEMDIHDIPNAMDIRMQHHDLLVYVREQENEKVRTRNIRINGTTSDGN